MKAKRFDFGSTSQRRVRVPPTDSARWDRIRRVRREIARGTYETPEKWRVTLDRLLEVVRRDP